MFGSNWSGRGNQFDLWNDWAGLVGKSVLYVDVKGRSGKLWRHFLDHRSLADFVRRRGDTAIETVHLTVLENFHIQGDLEKYFLDPLAYSVEKMKRRR